MWVKSNDSSEERVKLYFTRLYRNLAYLFVQRNTERSRERCVNNEIPSVLTRTIHTAVTKINTAIFIVANSAQNEVYNEIPSA